MSVGRSVSIICKYRQNSNTNADNHLIKQNSAWNTQHDYTKLNCKQGPCLSFFFSLNVFLFQVTRHFI